MSKASVGKAPGRWLDNIERTFAVVELVVNLGRKLEIAIVAEGVESSGQAEMLAKMGCGFGQGYFYARPEAAANAQVLLLG